MTLFESHPEPRGSRTMAEPKRPMHVHRDRLVEKLRVCLGLDATCGHFADLAECWNDAVTLAERGNLAKSDWPKLLAMLATAHRLSVGEAKTISEQRTLIAALELIEGIKP